jgi:hypothetical protein
MLKKNRAVSVDHFKSPIGGYGFRTGNRTVILEDGTTDKIYLSVPHRLSLAEQTKIILDSYNRE